MSAAALDEQAVTALRVLAMDAVEQAGSGHPGTPMGIAPLVYRLYTRFLRHDPSCPDWPDRDRFVLSCGHASLALYGVLHLVGYPICVDDLRSFRQLGSITPGHPEVGLTPGVEVSTGPLGQGLANAVGFAIAERLLAARANRPGHEVVDHRTVVLASDGDLMEGISHEAASLAGHLGLERLVVFYDDNGTTIDGPASLACSDDVVARFAAYGWRTLEVDDVEDLDAVDAVLADLERSDGRPAFVRVRSTIAFGAPTKAGTSAAHGAPLGPDEVAGARAALGWPHEPFVVPEAILRHADQRPRGAALRRDWQRRFDAYARAHPDAAAELARLWRGELPDGWDRDLDKVVDEAPIATRAASHAVLDVIAERVPELIGGAADLSASTGARIEGADPVGPGAWHGRHLHFGIREHAMAAVLNGMALHGGLRVFGGTYLVFTDYLRPALRMAALMRLPVVLVASHDSLAVGPDGPTHQPVEHVASLRAIPRVDVVRPADARETVGAWRHALARRDGPTVLVLSRQALAPVAGSRADGVEEGAYVVRHPEGELDMVLVASGSEVALTVAAAERLARDGVAARVVSLPCAEAFDRRPAADRDAVLPPGVPRLGVEAGSPLGLA
ncbi:MAG TPA: transketolase, partial [Egibacteraceae bacterium]